MKFKVSYVTTEPINGNAPSVELLEDTAEEFNVKFIDSDINKVIKIDKLNNLNKTVCSERQYYTNWKISVTNNKSSIIFTDKLNLENKVVFIKFDSFSLGDNIAWIPYVEEFRKKHECKIICSTFWNDLFENVYPDIMFVNPNTRISNIYAQYYIGTYNEINTHYQPIIYLNNPLQKIASSILGLKYQEIKPKIYIPNHHYNKVKQVCLSEYASLRVKEWNPPTGWQKVVDLFNDYNYKVIVISKEFTYLKNVINKSGDLPIMDRIIDIYNSNYFIGNSTGLSWLSWALNTHVFLISDFTPSYHEFQSNVTRIYNKSSVRSKILYENIENPVSIDDVLTSIEDRIKFDNLK